MRIFLSYGHDDYASLAVRIKHDLEAQGHQTWFDLDRLTLGSDWERYIEEGIDFVSAAPAAGRFLLLMTPDSVRRPNGYCLNELARAFSRNLPVIPVMISTVEPPLSICRLQWLDMRNCYPAEQHEEQYGKQFGRLVRALEEGQVPFEGVEQRLLNYLQPISYVDDFTRHLLHFTGRKWVTPEVEAWLASSQRVLWIAGETGIGKSALAAWLCNRRPEITACHFCRFGNRDRVDARKALFSLAYQLSTQLPVYRDRLNASPLDQTVIETNVPAVFDRLFVNLLSGPVPIADKSQVFLIDALDEATSNGKNDLALLIGSEFGRLPPWLRLIVTSRPHEQELNFALQALDPWKLEARRSENVVDIREYLSCELRSFTGLVGPSDELLNAILQKSEGLFLYASWVRQELQDGRLSLEGIDEFPRGLGGVYADFFRRHFPDLREYESDCRPALEAVCAAREPLEFRDLRGLLGLSEYKMRSLAARLGSLFHEVDGRLHPFHQSVRDWLTDSIRSGPYWIDVSAQEQRLAALAWQEYKNGVNTMGRYCIRHAPFHLAACQRKSRLRELLLDFEWIQAKFRSCGISELLADYDLALSAPSPEFEKPGADMPTVSPMGFPQPTKLTTWECEDSITGDTETSALVLVKSAIRMSALVIGKDPRQFASQMVGRLLLHQDKPAIKQFIARIVDGRSEPWLRPCQPTLHPAGTPLVRTLDGHTSVVKRVAVSADGRRALSASDDHTLKVWDLEAGRMLLTLRTSSSFVTGIAVSADGRRAVLAIHNHALNVWDLDLNRLLSTFDIQWRSVSTPPAISVDAHRAVAVSNDALRVWDLETGQVLQTLPGHFTDVRRVVVSADCRRAVSMSYDNTLRMYDLQTEQVLHMLKVPSYVQNVGMSADGRRAVLVSEDALRVWDLETGRVLHAVEAHSSSCVEVAISADGRLAVTACDDKTLKVWDLETGRVLRTLEGEWSAFTDLAMSADGRLAVSASWSGKLIVWNLQARLPMPMPERHSEAVNSVAVCMDRRRALSASDDKTLKVWDLETGRVLRTLEGHSGYVKAVAVSLDGRHAVSASFDETLKVWDLNAGSLVRSLEGHSSCVWGVALSTDGQRAISASWDQTLKVWDLETGRVVRTLEGHSGYVFGVAVTADKRHAVSASADQTLKVWEVETGRQLRTLRGHTGAVYGVALGADGRLAVSGSEDKTLRVWDLNAGSLVRTLEGHSSWVWGVALSTDGQRVATASDNTLKVWSLAKGMLICEFTCDASIISCAFAGNDKLIAGDAGGRLHFFYLEEPESNA